MEHVDDAHSAVQSALQAVASIELGSLRDAEREHALNAIRDLRDLDEALAVRSGHAAEQLGMGADGTDEPDTANALKAAREYGPSELYTIEGLRTELETMGYDVQEPEEPVDLEHATAPKDENNDPILDAEVDA